MEKIQVRFPAGDLEKIRSEVEAGQYPSVSEAVRDKVRKSYLLEAIVHMREAAEGMDEADALAALDATRATHGAALDERSD